MPLATRTWTLLIALGLISVACSREGDPTPSEPCAPSCGDRECGDDGCGGSCGDCPGGSCLEGRCCLPDCDGKTCGDDGCGGTCGECTGICTEGSCCLPDCDGKACGDDGCGGSCGSCADPCSGEPDDPSLCLEGTCLSPCCPDCDGKACGDDGCGGTCGTCDPGVCFEDRCCVPDCDGKACGDDGCGGSCGGCEDDLECREGACRIPCGREGFSPVRAVGSWKPYGDSPDGTLFYQAVDALAGTRSILTLEIRQAAPFAGPKEPGTYPFTASRYSKCDICLRLAEDCTETGCARQYLATEGTLVIEAMDRADGPFRASLRDVVFREALIDVAAWTSWVQPAGRTWCMDGIETVADQVALAVPEPACVAEGTGVLADQNIADFTLPNCNGDPVNLHSLCGEVKAVWLVLVAAWCPFCSEYAPLARQTEQSFGGKVRLLTVLGEDRGGNAPDQADCQAYARSHNLDPAFVLTDHRWGTTVDHIYPYGFQGIPYEMVLDGDNMAYIWSTGQRGNLGTVLESLVAW
ncbi:redoxin domain-containing protein [Myxococcota bacterium]|nr:redoxin domain-containing protein [Myxococcota bacterium]